MWNTILFVPFFPQRKERERERVCVCVCVCVGGGGEEVCEVYFAYEHKVSHGPLVGKHWFRTQNSQSHFFSNCGTYILCCIQGRAINNGMSYLWWLCVHEIGSSVWVRIVCRNRINVGTLPVHLSSVLSMVLSKYNTEYVQKFWVYLI